MGDDGRVETGKTKMKTRMLKKLKWRVINIPWLNYIDYTQLIKDIGLAKKVLVIDNHYSDSGLGMRVKSTLCNCEIEVSIHGVKEIPKSGTNQEILDYHGYNYENLKNILT